MEPDPREWSGLPAALLALVEAERAAGNRVAAIDRGFPAPPVGFCVLMEQDVSTRPPDADDGLNYRQWPNWKGYHGYADEREHFFVLNPPLPPPPDPVVRRAEPARAGGTEPPPLEARSPGLMTALVAGFMDGTTPGARFRQSMNIDYEKWREGIGYDLDALDAMNANERAAAETALLSRGAADWRDVEAMARLDTPACREVLTEALDKGNAEIRLAVMRHAPHLMTPETRVRALVAALATAAPFEGLSATMDEAARNHPPEVMDALWRGLTEREGGVAVHYAALLTHLHGRADSIFDLDQRPFFLTFNTDDPAKRAAAVAALRQRLGLPPDDSSKGSTR